MFSQMRHTDMFKPRTTFVAARMEEPEPDDEDQSPIVIPIAREPKQKRYCGEKLLRKLNKDRKKEAHKIDVAQISKSLSNIMREF
jgi:hypothetical protein